MCKKPNLWPQHPLWTMSFKGFTVFLGIFAVDSVHGHTRQNQLCLTWMEINSVQGHEKAQQKGRAISSGRKEGPASIIPQKWSRHSSQTFSLVCSGCKHEVGLPAQLTWEEPQSGACLATFRLSACPVTATGLRKGEAPLPVAPIGEVEPYLTLILVWGKHKCRRVFL